MTLILGAVAYDPKVVTIWEGFKLYFEQRGLDFDYVLYSNYERQVEALIGGTIHIAWNSPLAWIRARRLGRAHNIAVEAIAMRDTDCDLSSSILVRSDSAIRQISDLKGKTVAVGAIDSPQATLIPLLHLRKNGLMPGVDFAVKRHDLLCGKHGDHIGGERAAAQAILTGAADAACIIQSNRALFERDTTLGPGDARVIVQTSCYDHCNLTAGPAATSSLVDQFRGLLFGMSIADPEVGRLFELEGLNAWKEPRTEGYEQLEAAVDAFEFYDQFGNITAAEYFSRL